MVVGGAGFLGSHLVDRLLAEGSAVDVVDDLSTGSLSNLRAARQLGVGLKIHNVDARSGDFESLVGIRQPGVIYHLALLPRPAVSADATAAAFSTLVNTMEAARRHGVSRVVVPLPASALYGHPAAASLPIKEADLEPRGVRGVTARAMFDVLCVYRERHAVEFAVLALGSVYGPRQRAAGGVVAAFMSAAASGSAPTIHGDGRQTRDFVYIDDVTDALFRAGERGSGLVINVGTGEQTQVRMLWDMIGGPSAARPQHGPARVDELSRFSVSAVRARIHLSWSPWTALPDGIERLRAELDAAT